MLGWHFRPDILQLSRPLKIRTGFFGLRSWPRNFPIPGFLIVSRQSERVYAKRGAARRGRRLFDEERCGRAGTVLGLLTFPHPFSSQMAVEVQIISKEINEMVNVAYRATHSFFRMTNPWVIPSGEHRIWCGVCLRSADQELFRRVAIGWAAPQRRLRLTSSRKTIETHCEHIQTKPAPAQPQPKETCEHASQFRFVPPTGRIPGRCLYIPGERFNYVSIRFFLISIDLFCQICCYDWYGNSWLVWGFETQRGATPRSLGAFRVLPTSRIWARFFEQLLP